MNELPNPVLTDRFYRAVEFAGIAHASQVRKCTSIPYMAHLMAVTSLVLEHGASEDVAIAAMLHDAAEDQGGYPMLAQIKARFGEHVACIVKGCTDTFEDPKPNWHPRKKQYIEHLREADLDTCLVSVADKLHNARSILHDMHNTGAAVFNRFTASAEPTGWYYASVARVLHQRLAGSAAAALANALLHDIRSIADHQHGKSFAIGAERGGRGEPWK